MSNDDRGPPDRNAKSIQNARPPSTTEQEKRSLFSIPPPLKRIFDKFPLVTYADNALPLRASTTGDENVLYIFTNKQDAKLGRPSFNPSCLKWQTYLRLTGVSFKTVSSTNHASPSGALPFLLPAAFDSTKPADPISSSKLRKWIAAQTDVETVKEPEDVQYESYASLLENCIRKAWLFQLYLSPANSAVVHRFYVEPCSSNSFVQQTILYQLRSAAESELLKTSTSSKISELDIMGEAEAAIEALVTLLGQEDWFFGQQKPTLFDASVFAYTHLILDENLDWKDNKLGQQLKWRDNLVQHRDRILEMYY